MADEGELILWSPLLREIENDASRIRHLWIKEVYWRLLLPDDNVDSALTSDRFNWEETADRVLSMAVVLPVFWFTPGRMGASEVTIPNALTHFRLTVYPRRNQQTVSDFIRQLYAEGFGETVPQLVD